MIRSLTAAIALASLAAAQTVDDALVAKLRTAATNTDRVALLKDDQFVYNFMGNVGRSDGYSGRTIQANSGNFPALIGNGVAMTVGYLEACGMNIPHTHPRATEINYAVNGTLLTGMLAENGARYVTNEVPAGHATVFPQGVIHFEMNLECEPVVFVAAFNNEDPGVLAIAQRFFGLAPDVVGAAFGNLGVVEVASLEAKIPNNIAQGTDSCLKRCGLTRAAEQPGSQRQLRVAGNALPPGYMGPPPPPPATPAPPASTETPGSNFGTTPAYDAALNGNTSTSPSIMYDQNVKPILIALVVINGLFAIGVLFALFVYVVRKRGGKAGPPRRMMTETQDVPRPRFAPLREEDDDKYDPHYETKLLRSPSPNER